MLPVSLDCSFLTIKNNYCTCCHKGELLKTFIYPTDNVDMTSNKFLICVTVLFLGYVFNVNALLYLGNHTDNVDMTSSKFLICVTVLFLGYAFNVNALLYLRNHTDNVDMTSSKFVLYITVLLCRPCDKCTTP